LRAVADEAPPVVRGQIIERQQALWTVAIELRAPETALHDIACRLFELTPAERRTVEQRRQTPRFSKLPSRPLTSML
jgi:hypothetical protein